MTFQVRTTHVCSLLFFQLQIQDRFFQKSKIQSSISVNLYLLDDLSDILICQMPHIKAISISQRRRSLTLPPKPADLSVFPV